MTRPYFEVRRRSPCSRGSLRKPRPPGARSPRAIRQISSMPMSVSCATKTRRPCARSAEVDGVVGRDRHPLVPAHWWLHSCCLRRVDARRLPFALGFGGRCQTVPSAPNRTRALLFRSRGCTQVACRNCACGLVVGQGVTPLALTARHQAAMTDLGGHCIHDFDGPHDRQPGRRFGANKANRAQLDRTYEPTPTIASTARRSKTRARSRRCSSRLVTMAPD